MNIKVIGIIVVAIIAVTILVAYSSNAPTPTPAVSQDAKLGLVINTPQSSVTLQDLDQTYELAASSGIGRSNVYMFWDILEPERGQYDWTQYDTIMGLNEKNDLAVTLYFSLINGKTLGPFPSWIGNPPLRSVSVQQVTDTLDAVLSRYHIIDHVIVAGGTDEHFRYAERDISFYAEMFNAIYDTIKSKHPNVKIGNSFELHNILNKNLQSTAEQLALGDFVGITYTPTDSLNEINRTPTEAIADLDTLGELFPNKKIGILEISWSTSESVEGTAQDQSRFIGMLYDYYDNNREDIEFMTWYRLYDRPENSCDIDESELDGPFTLGNSTFVAQRLGDYVCNAGLITVTGESKLGWEEFLAGIKP